MKSIKTRIIVSGLIVFASLASCTTTRVATLTRSENEKVELFMTKIPEKNYTELSYIQTDGTIFHTPQQLLNGLKKKAAKLQADAVINIRFDFQAYLPIVSGTAIKFKDN